MMMFARFQPHPFPRQYRLTKTDEFSSVFGFRRVLRGKSFLLHYGESRPAGAPAAHARLGVVIGKKFLRHAVGRNCVKRIAREAFRLVQSQLPPRDLVLRLSVKMQKPKRQARLEIAAEIRQLLAKIQEKRP
ncbi:ribonuclease P protein component [Betaproteobacteria bacterium]|nr:ribonuclease P protein component [Betaproteobacteria bacterium]